MRRFHYLSTSAAQPYCVAATIAWVACNTPQAVATPITYIYSGNGTGQLGSSPFFNANFTITALADTINIKPWGDAVGGPQNTHLSTMIDIAGVGSYLITTPSHTWMDGSHDGSGDGGLGKNLGVNWIMFEEHTLADYGLNTPIGPVLEDLPTDVEQFHDISTSGGLLKFDSISTVTFTAIITPEPSSGILFLVGFFATQLHRTRRRPLTS
jgi:hypothetical protein